MPTCVECGLSVTTLVTEYSKGNIVLTQCENCKKFADKYVEHDFVIIFIDMILHKPQVYRHLLFNRLEYQEKGIEPNVLKLGILLVLFDVYIKWFKLENYYGEHNFPYTNIPMHIQYIYILTICVLEFLALHAGVRLATSFYVGNAYAIVKYNYVSMAMILSSFGKLLLILMVIWDYNELEYSWLVNLLVLTSNVEALSVFLNIDNTRSLGIVAFGMACKALCQLIVYAIDPSTAPWAFTF